MEHNAIRKEVPNNQPNPKIEAHVPRRATPAAARKNTPDVHINAGQSDIKETDAAGSVNREFDAATASR